MVIATKYKQVCRLQLYGDDDLYSNNSNSVYSLPGPILGITLVSGGTNYTVAPTILFSGGGGYNAAATCTTSGNSVNAITITNYGNGYTTLPTITFTQQVIGTTGLVGGTGYTSAPTISFIGGGGSGAAATAVITVGVVTSINITSNGSGYTSAPTMIFTPTNGGSGASATANLNTVATATALGCIINSKRIRFNLNNNLSHIQLSNNARCVLEMCNIPSLTNWAGKSVIVRLGCATRDTVLDTKKFLNGNPILLSYALSSTVNAPNILFNCSEFFYNINVPSNFLQLGYIDLELECPTATTAVTLIGAQPPLNTFYINLVIVDEDLEQTKDNALAPQINYDLNTNNFNRGKLYN
jgi:hypothetical protein